MRTKTIVALALMVALPLVASAGEPRTRFPAEVEANDSVTLSPARELAEAWSRRQMPAAQATQATQASSKRGDALELRLDLRPFASLLPTF